MIMPEIKTAAGEVVAVSIAERKGMRKRNAASVEFKEDHGITGDAHAGPGIRQISLLMEESIDKMRALGLNVGPGDFAENITVKGIDLLSLKLGDILRLGEDVRLEITKFGKECHARCAIYDQAGDCVMPREGVFARVLKGGGAKPGDKIDLLHQALGIDSCDQG